MSVRARRIGKRAGILAAFLGACPAALAAGGGEDVSHEAQFVWQAVNLLILVGVLVYFARKPIASFLVDRREKIRGDLDEAAELLRQAESRYAEWQRKLIDLDQELEGIRSDARRHAEEERENILADAHATVERIHRDATASVEREVRLAQAELRREAAEIATDMAEQILRERIGEPDRDRLMDEFITRVDPAEAGRAGRA